MKTREEFGDMLRAMGLTGVAVEVGVLSGVFSNILYSKCPFIAFFLVDSWKAVGGERVIEDLERCNKTYEIAYKQVKEFAAGKNVYMIRDVSLEAAKIFNDGQLDFVYIDAEHYKRYVERDIEAWWPKVKKGGVLAGHDYYTGINWEYYVKGAVDEFCARAKLTVNVTTDDPPYYSWWVVK